MAIVAQGQISIVDLHDMPPVRAHLESNKSKTIVKTLAGYNPVIASGNELTVTAELYEANSTINLFSRGTGSGETGDIIGITWTVRKGDAIIQPSSYGTYGISLATPSGWYANSQMKINKQETAEPNLTVSAEISYKYSGMKEATPVIVDIDFATIYNGTDGADGESPYNVSMSNTNHIFPVDGMGNLLPGTEVTSVISAYKGVDPANIKDVTYSYPGPIAPPFNISIDPLNGTTNTATITISVPTVVTQAALKKLRMAGRVETESGSIVFTVILVDDQNNPREVDFSWAISSRGANGEDGTSYWLMPDNTRVLWQPYAGSGTYHFSPAEINLSAKQQSGSSPVINMTSPSYSTKFYNLNGDQIGDPVTTSKITLSASTHSQAVKMVCELRNSSGTLLDVETIDIVKVSKDPVTVSLSSDTNEVRNNTGTAILTFMIYRSGQDVSTSSGAITWTKDGTAYIPPTTGVPANLKTNQTFITGNNITNFANMKASITIQGTTYSDSITILDISDPILLTIDSSGGEQFINNSGSSDLTARLWQNGLEIDSGGTQYTYTWKKNNANGVAENFADGVATKTGKKISITNLDVNRKATFICQLSDK